MRSNIIFLSITLVLIPVLAFGIDHEPSIFQKEMLMVLGFICVATALLCFIVSSLAHNYSQVDKLWSLMPVIYTWLTAVRGDYEPRLVLMAAVVSVWGLRLTFNFARRSGYSWRFWSGKEDYRWAVLRSGPLFTRGWKWVVFNLGFISLYQMGLILLFTLPVVRSAGGRDLGFADWILAALLIGFVVVETVADQQQWDYHKRKKMLSESLEELPPKFRKGFVSTGLWSVVRHPNYASEQAIWIVFYFFSVSATGQWLNWSVAGCLLLVLLFYGSSNFSESISAGKYPEYREYKKRVPRFIPFLK